MIVETADEILSMPLAEKLVEFEGKQYRLRELNKKGKFDVTKIRRTMISHSWVNSNGERIVIDSDKLKTMRRSLAGYLYEECQKLNRYEPGELEGLAKNSDPAAS